MTGGIDDWGQAEEQSGYGVIDGEGKLRVQE